MLKDLMDRDRAAREYGLPRELATLSATPQAIQPMPTIQPLPPIEDVQEFEAEDFMPKVALPRSTECETLTGQDALEEWATQTAAIRQGKTIPTIHRHSNAALREKHLHDVRCPSCGLEFAAEVES
jgi:hypothetical protein